MAAAIAPPPKLASTTASTHQATASSMQPAARASVPSAVPVSPRSWMMRASIGNAVIDIAAPRKSIASAVVTRSEKRPGMRVKAIARPEPSANGSSMPDSDTLSALRSRLRKSSVLNSTPTRNM